MDEKKADFLIDARKISKRYVGVQALDQVDFLIKKGEIKCLVGENGCGKSTLIKMITGVEKFDSGNLTIDGHTVGEHYDFKQALKTGIQVIYQDLSLFDHMTVEENIVMSYLIANNKTFIDPKEMRTIAVNVINKIGVSLPLDTEIEELSIANRQMVAICRALTQDAKVIFMDEPTTALTKNEVSRLLEVVRGLKAKQMSVVFVSHKLDEVFAVADSIMVIRDGVKVGDFNPKELDQRKLSYYMTGSEVIYNKYEKTKKSTSPAVIELKDLSRKAYYHHINLKVNKSDIFGIIGLLGSGRTELALSMFGLNQPDAGEIFFEGVPVQINSPKQAINLGIGLVPEDRAVQGLFLKNSILKNVSVPVMDAQKTKIGSIDIKKQELLAEKMRKMVNIKTPSVMNLVETLSGGNQQKVSLGKWIATNPKILILDSPTVGIDIGSKSEIYHYIQELAKSGIAVIIISDEIEEIVTNCNRVAVMSNGEIVREYQSEELAADSIQKDIAAVIEESYVQSRNMERA